jgi:hypothetical protein
MQGKVLKKIAENCEDSFTTSCIKSNREQGMLYYFRYTKNKKDYTIVRMNLDGEVSAECRVTLRNRVLDMDVLDDGSLLVCINSSHDIYRISQDLKECHAVETDSTDTYSICFNRKLKKIYTGSYSSNLLKVYDLKL